MRFKYKWMMGLLFSLCCSASFAEITPSGALALYGNEIESLKKNIEQNLKRDLATQDTQSSIDTNNKGEIIAFVSFSMPQESIKQWMGEADLYGASLNIRGLIENSMPKTMIKLQQLIAENHNQGGINIDPELFELYGIEKVPAVIVRQYSGEDSPFDIVYGTSSIKEALLLIHGADGITKQQVAEILQ